MSSVQTRLSCQNIWRIFLTVIYCMYVNIIIYRSCQKMKLYFDHHVLVSQGLSGTLRGLSSWRTEPFLFQICWSITWHGPVGKLPSSQASLSQPAHIKKVTWAAMTAVWACWGVRMRKRGEVVRPAGWSGTSWELEERWDRWGENGAASEVSIALDYS